MGNGAPVAAQAAGPRQYDYPTVERLSRKGYFAQNFDEYKRAIQEAVRTNELDVLEVLIPAGNAKMALPLHIAASMGNVEACELLLSAGFGFLSTDPDGRTPLHLCAMNRSGSVDASVCITLLGLQGSKAVNMRDRQGCTPLHCAAALDNVDAVRWLLDIKGINVKMANGDGHTVRDIARRKGYTQIVELLDVKEGYLREDASKVMKSLNSKSKAASSAYSAPVDQERIMQVWEKFFENAYKHMESESSAAGGGLMFDSAGLKQAETNVKSKYCGALYGDEDDSDDEGRYSRSTSTPSKGSLSATAKQPQSGVTSRSDYKSTGSSKSNVSSHHHPSQNATAEEYKRTTSKLSAQGSEAGSSDAASHALVKKAAGGVGVQTDMHPGVLAWFQFICCFEASNNSLYTINVLDGTTSWLEEHLAYHQYWYQLIPPEWLADVDSYLSLPTDCALLVRCGWMTYYDPATNECCWYNIPSRHSLSCLPIGYDPMCDTPEGQTLGLLPYEGSQEWRTCPHAWTVSHSWVAVLVDGEEVEQSHTRTAHTNGANSSANKQTNNPTTTQNNTTQMTTQKTSNPSKSSNQSHETSPAPAPLQYYFLNQITGFTTWHAPEGWDEMIRDHWGGWILCMSEGSDWAIFWWNPATSESVWV